MRNFTFLKWMFLIAVILGNASAFAEYTGTGSFTKITSAVQLADGYYVVMGTDNRAMNNNHNGTYFSYTAITPVSDVINDPIKAIVWKITTHSDGGFIIYNEDKAKYVSYTGNKNNVQFVQNVTDAHQRWNITYDAGHFKFSNKAVPGRKLQYNDGNPRFACYTGFQKNLDLYKLDEISSSTVAPTFFPESGTYFAVQFVELTSATTGAKIYYTTDGNEPTNASTPYTAAIEVNSNTTIKAIAYDENNTNPSAVVTAEYIIDLTPQITVIPNAIEVINDIHVGASEIRTLTVDGFNLTQDLTVSLTGDIGHFAVSPGTIAPIGGVIANTPITVTYTPTEAGSHTVTVQFTSPELTAAVTRTIAATAIYPPLAAPRASVATAITNTGFTANWDAVPGATGYEMNVYTKTAGLDQEMVINGGFETGKISPWGGSGVSHFKIKTDVPQEGEKYVKNAFNTAELKQVINVVKDKTYVFSFWYNNYGAVNEQGLKDYTIHGTKGSAFISGESAPTKLPAANVWTKYEKEFTATATKVTISIRAYEACEIDNISLREKVMVKSPIEGSPFTTTETSFAITGLNNADSYFYAVKAKNAHVESPFSDEVGPISLLSTELSGEAVIARAWAAEGKLHVEASVGEIIEAFNIAGQKLLDRVSVTGINSIDLPVKGVVIVKIGNRLTKVIL